MNQGYCFKRFGLFAPKYNEWRGFLTLRHGCHAHLVHCYIVVTFVLLTVVFS